MTIFPLDDLNLIPLFCDWPSWGGAISIEQLDDVLVKIRQHEGQLLTLWGSDESHENTLFRLHMLFLLPKQGTLYLYCNLSEHQPQYPDLTPYFPQANRLQRALFDLLGFKATNSKDSRPWLRHGAWPLDIFPLRKNLSINQVYPAKVDDYPFIRVHGDGVHEIPVGPVHAGTIEPGHFRFQVLGERILKLEERLGYTHKGIAKHFQGTPFNKGAKLASRISGDNTVAYAWSYCMALENLHQTTAPPRALWLRALLLERERIMNHLGDLGALGNDVGFRFGYNQFSHLKETLLRLNTQLFGHRYLMDAIVPGGVAFDLSSTDIRLLQQEGQTLKLELATLKAIYNEHDGLQDRFVTTGTIDFDLACKLGLSGLAARASGIDWDWRKDMPSRPYNQLVLQGQKQIGGDVAARVAIRFQEIEESLSLMETLFSNLSGSNIVETLPPLLSPSLGFGCVEGWRGPVITVLANKDEHHLNWAHIHDPSWQNWPALEHAVMGNIVPDFPLINKSFNLSYSGHDG